MKYYDIENNLVTVSNSLLKHFSCPTFHDSCKALDEVLNKTTKKICVILLDGFGKLIQEHASNYCPYILKHKKIEITSVFPPTTAAATTSLLTGKYPVETGWLGWNQLFRKWDDIVTMFRSKFASSNNDTPVNMFDYVHNKTIDLMMKEHNPNLSINTLKSLDLKNNDCPTFFNEVNKKCKESDFLYAYYTNPDHSLHIHGEGSKEVNDEIKLIDAELEKLVNENKDILFITLADHGHIISKDMDIRDHKDFYELLKYKFFSLEQRACVFYVEKENHAKFLELAKKYYGAYFDIYTKQEVIDNKIFGIGTPHKYFDYCIGDFLLIANSDRNLRQTCSPDLISEHAGGTDIEKYINIGIFNN